MKKILLMGAGKIGEMISSMLANSGDYHVTVADRDEMALARMPKHPEIDTQVVDALDSDAMDTVMAGKYAVLMACGHVMTHVIAPAAKKAGAHYFDLTEDVANMTQPLARQIQLYSFLGFILSFFGCYWALLRRETYTSGLIRAIKNISDGNLDVHLPLPKSHDQEEDKLEERS